MKHILTIIKRVVVKFYQDSCLVRASGLAYSTLLSIVPFITIIYAFGGFDALGRTIQTKILKAIISTQHQAVIDALDVFTKNSLKTGTVGMIFFLLTSVFLINTVARNFDTIWGVSSNINFFRRYATYTAVLVFGSLLLGLSNSLSDSIENYILSVGIGEITGLSKFFNHILPFLIALTIFFAMFIIIPSIKVKFKAGFIGALTSAILFELIKKIFTFWAFNSVRTSFIYGSVAVIPMFLVSLYLTWLVILIGVEISFIIQNENRVVLGSIESLLIEEKLTIGIDVFLLIGKAYYDNRVGGITLKELEKSLMLSSFILNPILLNFQDRKLLLKITNGGYIPSRSLDRIKLTEVVSTIYGEHSRFNAKFKIAEDNAKAFTLGGYNSLSENTILEIIKKDILNETEN